MLSIFSSSQMWPRYLRIYLSNQFYSFNNSPEALSKQMTALDVVLATIHWLSLERETEQTGTTNKQNTSEPYYQSSPRRAFQLEYHMFEWIHRQIYVIKDAESYPVTIETSSTHNDVILSVASLSVCTHCELWDLDINNQNHSVPCVPKFHCCIITTRSKNRTVLIIW